MCCSRVISWSRNSRMPFQRKVRWIWSMSALLSGWARSTSAISAPIAWESGLTVRGIGSPKGALGVLKTRHRRKRCAPPVRPSRFAAAFCGTTVDVEGGKSVIALYIGKSDVASSYGAAGALIILLLWVFYSAQIFLLGARFPRAFARRYGTHVGHEVSSPIPS